MARDERFEVRFSRDEMERIDNWRFANRSRSRAEAMRDLIDKGLAQDGLADDGGVQGLRTSPAIGPTGKALEAPSHITNR